VALTWEAERSVDRAAAPDRIALFGALWAIAALLHLLAVGPDGPAWSQAALALAAGLALSWPGAVVPLALLAGAGAATAWYEAPGLSDHWLLVGLVDLAILVSVLVGAVRRRLTDRIDLADRLFPTARLCLLGAYGFAAFAKLNDGYLDRRVSCAVVRFRDATSSVGLEALQLDGTAWLERTVILGVLAASIAVPVLLVVRRFRWAGLALALALHVLVGLDRSEPHFAASAALVALLSLFLPGAGPWAVERVGSVRARLALRGPRLPLWLRLVLAGGPTVLGLLVAADRLSPETGEDVGWWAWQACAVVVVVAAVRLLRQPRAAERVRLLPYHALYALVPLLVLLNGLGPYLELKTGAAWASAANLRTVGGETNHLLVGGTASLSGDEADVVRIVDTDDPVLAGYRSRAVGLTWRELRSYLHDHPDVSVAYVRDGRRVALTRAADRPELVEAVPAWQEKLLPFRPVDLIEPERCLAELGPSG
jgi:hypothetical protein